MGPYLVVRVRFWSSDKVPDIEKRLHELYKKYGMELVYIDSKEVITYEDACKDNQKCFDELIEFDEWKHHRITWKSDWIASIDTYPDINIILPNYENNKPYDVQKSECILFPEEKVTKDVFNNILSLVADLYNLDFVYSVKIEKEM